MKKVFGKNAKISDYFKKNPTSNHHAGEEIDNKRKLPELGSPDSKVLGIVTNLPQKCSPKVSPLCKKSKHDENDVCDQSSSYFLQSNLPIQAKNVCHNSLKNDDHNASPINGYKSVPFGPKFKFPMVAKTPSPIKSSSYKGSGQKNITPGSKKGTPKKLFKKSPNKLDEFNVKILENFIQLSPTVPNGRALRQNGSLKKTAACAINFEDSCLGSKERSSQSLNNSITELVILKDMNNCNLNSEPQKNIQGATMDAENNIDDELDMTLDDFFGEEFTEEMEHFGNLTFAQPQYCKILEVEKLNNRTVLKLESLTNKDTGLCSVEDFWSSLNCKVGDKVYISAVKNATDQWVINNNDGLLVYEPDVLISCTSVVGSLFCKRKSVLSERFRGFESDNRHMIIGVLIHHLLEQVLKNNVKTANEVEAMARKLLKSRNTIKRLYDNDLTLENVETELLTFVPKIADFVRQYVRVGSTYHQLRDNWQGIITEINDIEENMWCPELGIKGKIDVTVNTLASTMPLELKTGRASMSLEHKGQVMLYIMMMNRFGYKVSSGLLLYLREGVVKEVKATPREQRDIMILRNELAYFLSRGASKENGDAGPIIKSAELPEPINHRACLSCPYNPICTSYLKADNYDFCNNKFLENINDSVTSYLTEAHINYFIHWSNMLSIDNEPIAGFKTLREIYTVNPEKREKQGKCIINLKITKVGAECNSVYKHTFEKNQTNTETSLIASGIFENNYVVISTDSRPAVATGFVTEIDSNFICVALDRNLQLKYRNKLFHVDTYDSNITQTFNLTSLALILEKTPRAAQLRSIIIDRTIPTFCQKLPAVIAKRGKPILTRLNPVQQKAVLKALCAQEYLLIKGMPGTGKTATIIALIQLLVQLNKTVLITSHTHSAIDNICSRLMKYEIDFIRLGSESRVDTNLKSKCEASLTKDCHTPEDFKRVYNSFNVIAVTCLGSGHPLLSKRTMDVCIVDESTQAIQTSVIRPLYAAKTFVLIGDPEQLAPVVRNRDAVIAGMAESLFERLNTNSEGIITLDINYRMNSTITNLVNILTYQGQLKVANDTVAKNCLKIPNQEVVNHLYERHHWLLKALDTSLEAAVQFIDTGPVWQLSQDHDSMLKGYEFSENSDAQNCLNIHEASIVATLVNALVKGGVSNTNISVIATYRTQVAQISAMVSGVGVEVSTVDQFQGRDKNVIIYSCVKSKDMTKTTSDVQKFELLEDKRRLTVAISRAKQKLLIVGDSSTLQNYSTFSVILKSLHSENIIEFDSEWRHILRNFQ